MKFTSLTIDQFQRIAAIEVAGDEKLKKVAIYSVLKGITLDEAKNVKLSEVNAEYKAIEAELKNLPPLKFSNKIKVNGKRYRLSLYTDELTAGQLLELLSYPMSNEYQVIQNIHKIMATLAKERTWFGVKKYDGAHHSDRAEMFQKHCTMGQVWGAVSFFLLASDHFLRNILTYSEAIMKTMAKDLASDISMDGL